MAGLTIPISFDLTGINKQVGIAYKDLQTLTGQKYVIKLTAELDDKKFKDILDVRNKLIGLHEQIGTLSYKKGKDEKLLLITSLKDAQRAIKQYKKELKSLEEYTTDASGKKVRTGRYGDEDRAKILMKNIATAGSWIENTKIATMAFGKHGMIDVDREKQRIKELRSSLTKEMSGLRKELDSVSGSDLESLKLKEQLLNRLIAKQQQYNKTLSRVSDTALGKVNSLRDEKSSIVAQQKKIAFQEKEAEMLRKINLLEQDRANAKTLDTKLEQLRAERVAIGKLITAWEQ